MLRPPARLLHTAAALCLALTTVLGLPAVPASAAAPDVSATVGADCPLGRLQLTLANRSAASQTFTVTWPGRSGSPWTRTVAAGGNTMLQWTVPPGTPYSLRVTASGFDRTQAGTARCGLEAGTPQMNTTALLGTGTAITGLNGPGGPSTGTAASVRIPGMAVTNDGTIIAVADARVDGSYDLGGGTNNIQLVLMRSTDDGLTWEPPRVIHHAATTSEGAGDPSVLVDRSTGAVYVFYTYSPRPGVGFWAAGSGSNAANDPDSLHIQYIKSTDDGAGWSSPVELNPSVKDPAWQQLFASSGHGVQTSGGRLVQPIVYRDAAGVSRAANIYSDDHGATWRRGSAAAGDVNESKAVERSNGDVVQNMRHNSVRSRFLATSADGGRTFGAAAASAALTDPLCNADETSYLLPGQRGAGGAPLRTATVLFSNNAHPTSRNDLTVRLSEDDGAHWTARALVRPGSAGYSTTAVLARGEIGVLYEVGATGGIFFARFTLPWLKAAG
ncbi:hypothetical protein GCM10017673_13040 [Streptosporangium violaceochromogenes]|nr:hypothetical protein GCM10017673_13040 [Streptosporangium violaceochromogenes]